MKNLFLTFCAVLVLTATAACSSTTGAQITNAAYSDNAKRWTGVLAVKESPLVNQIMRDNNMDPAAYYLPLREALDRGDIQSAPGRYCLIPYDGGRATDNAECFNTQGVYTMWAPASMVQNGKAMCASVPNHWPAIAGQLRYPERGGRRVNCYDFGPEARSSSFAASRDTAAMVVLVEPAG